MKRKQWLWSIVLGCMVLWGATESVAVPNKYRAEFESLPVERSYDSVQARLLAAIAENNFYAVEELLAQNSHVNFKGSVDTDKEYSPLGLASAKGSKKLIELLIKHGAHKNNPLETILPAAEAANIANFLYFYNRGLNKVCSDDDLFTAASIGGRIELVQLLLEKGHRLNVHNSSLLHASISNCEGAEVTKFLLEQGANPNAIDKESNRTPLMSALYAGNGPTPMGNHEAIAVLIQYGADPFAPRNDIENSLFYVASLYHETTFSDEQLYALLQGKKCSIPDSFKHTVIEHLLQTKLRIIAINEDIGEGDSYQDKDCSPEFLRLINKLIALGAKPNQEAIVLAGKCGYRNLMKVLLANYN